MKPLAHLVAGARLAVTGANGFVGSRVLERVKLAGEQGPRVLALARRPTPALRLLEGQAGHRVGLFDLGHEAALQAQFDEFQPTHVLHLAGLASPRACEQDPDRAHDSNITLTESLVEAAQEVGARLLLASTAQVYGRSNQPLKESAPREPSSVYGRTKAVAEERLFAAVPRGARALVARAFNHSGPGQSEEYVLPAFAGRLARGRSGQWPLEVGNLEAWRDFLHVDDVIDGYMLLLHKGQVGQAYNLCRGSAERIGDLWLGLGRRLGYGPEQLAQRTRTASPLLRPGEPDVLLGDGSRLAGLGFVPKLSIDRLLDELAEPFL